MKKKIKFTERILLLLLICILITPAINALGVNSQNISEQQEAAICLNESVIVMNELKESGFNTIRVNDTIKEAQLIYNSQLILKTKKTNYDFSKVLTYCEEIKALKQEAFIARDKFNALSMFYNQTLTKKMNTSSVDSIMNEITNEIESERYEKVKDLVDKAYQEISRVQAEYTALNIFYRSTARGINNFIKNNWKTLSIIAILLVVFFLVYRLRIARWIVNNKMEKLQVRKKTIKSLIMALQRDYFQEGKVAEGEYNIKTKKFAELIRDIDRQIPLLQEQLLKLESVKRK